MLLIPTYTGKSAIHGIGLFAAAAIPQGTRMWEYRDGFDNLLSVEYVEALPELAKAHIKHCCGLLRNGFYLQTGDNDRFINHSDSPNMVTDAAATSAVAARDIEAHEEITEDYRTFDTSWPQGGRKEAHAATERSTQTTAGVSATGASRKRMSRK